MKTVKLLQSGLWSSGFFKDNVCSLVCYTRTFDRDIRVQKTCSFCCSVFVAVVLFSSPWCRLLCWYFFFKYASSPSLWRRVPDALHLLWVKKGQLTVCHGWMFQWFFCLLATLLNVGHFGFVTFQLVRNKLLLQLPRRMCLLLWQFVSSFFPAKPLDKCNDWKGCIFYLLLLYPSNCCELTVLQDWVLFCFCLLFGFCFATSCTCSVNSSINLVGVINSDATLK